MRALEAVATENATEGCVREALGAIAPRSFGASIQVVGERGRAALSAHLGARTADPPPQPDAAITRGLPIRTVHLDRILAGTKTWEIRSRATTKRGPVALIESGSGTIVGVCEILDVLGPLSLADLQRNARRARVQADELPYDTTYAWARRPSPP